MRNVSQSIPDIWVQSERPRRRATITSTASSGANEGSPLPNDSTISISQSSVVNTQLAEGRDSDERQDTVGELQSPQLKAQRSANFSRHSTESRPSSGGSIMSVIPAWARSYYSRGEHSFPSPQTNTSMTDVSDSRLGTAQTVQSTAPSRSPIESSFPLSIFNPRRRLRQASLPEPPADTPAVVEVQDAPVEEEIFVVGGPRPAISEPFTPRLSPDRRSNARLSTWRPPSLDEALGNLVFSRANIQIMLFCFGFIFPLSWLIAAFIPLPPKPERSKEAATSQHDVECAVDISLGPCDVKGYLKAKWWRNLNRIMAVLGVALVGAIIAVAVVASRA
ncbi:hypothetical protein W97_00962 [Coniosporium apollinis CBS 100218]|uniref:Serine-rich protein n=1 Tax=Coniosporium apollinis (strain CBS 100218) TaxID=1168221 RepID=R7YJE0_CONA1|nr:uncharacterized protein W97_00962 [Coniosporium apollinis CBS 100218]EON61746.1 hypothetical protein W97_00962 [Coniosporium apollinis CBS 100218]